MTNRRGQIIGQWNGSRAIECQSRWGAQYQYSWFASIGDDYDLCEAWLLKHQSNHRFLWWKWRVLKPSCALPWFVSESGFISGLVAVLHDTTEQDKARERRLFVFQCESWTANLSTSVKSYLEALDDGVVRVGGTDLSCFTEWNQPRWCVWSQIFGACHDR